MGQAWPHPRQDQEHHVADVWRVFSWHLAHGPKSVVATGDSQGFRPAFVISFGTFWLLTFDFVPSPLPTCAAKQQTGKEEKTLSVGFPVTLPSVCLQVAVPRHGPACRCFSGCMCSGADRDKDWKLSANLKQTRRPPSFHPSIARPPPAPSRIPSLIAHRSSHRPSHPPTTTTTMSDSESVDYLQDGFDPWSLTVPRLRSILVTHNVQYSATAKKPQLVELFEDQVVPQAKKYLAVRARAKRTSRGIVDADSQSTTSTDFDQDLRPPPQLSARSRSPRKSSRIKHDSEDPEPLLHTPAPVRESPRKRQSRSVSAQPPPAPSDTETAFDGAASRSTTKSRRTTPAPKLEPRDDDDDNFFKNTPETKGVFSTENPFQSGGSSPPAPLKTPSNRRKTADLNSIRKSAVQSASRRRTDGPAFDDYYDDHPATISRSFEIPLPRTPKNPAPSNVVEPGEEFTPEEQLALIQEEQADPQLALTRRKAQAPRRKGLSTPLWVLAVTVVGAYAAWYRQEKVAVGYCGLGKEPNQLIPSAIELPEWATELTSKLGVESIPVPDWIGPLLEPECEPCPPHAYCYDDFSVRCEADFILKPHPLALGGLVPLPPTCEPDGEKVRRVQTVADKAVEELRDRRAKFECGEPAEPEGPPLESPAIEEDELREILSQKRSKRMAADEFDELWLAALGEVKARDEVVVQVEESPAE